MLPQRNGCKLISGRGTECSLHACRHARLKRLVWTMCRCWESLQGRELQERLELTQKAFLALLFAAPAALCTEAATMQLQQVALFLRRAAGADGALFSAIATRCPAAFAMEVLPHLTTECLLQPTCSCPSPRTCCTCSTPLAAGLATILMVLACRCMAGHRTAPG